MVGDEARQRSNLSEHTDLKYYQNYCGRPNPKQFLRQLILRQYLVDLCYNGVQDLAFEGSEDNGLIFNRVNHEALSRLDYTRADIVNRRYSDDKSVPEEVFVKFWEKKCIESAMPGDLT